MRHEHLTTQIRETSIAENNTSPSIKATQPESGIMLKKFIAVILLSILPLSAFAKDVKDRREGYYYPPITSEEVFDRTIAHAPKAGGSVRTAFITELTKGQLNSPTKPRIAIFGKGGETQHLIVVALDDDIFSTLFRARAVMAQLTSHARTTPLFKKNNIQFGATWYDLAKILGFKDIILTDGKEWSHKIVIKQ